MFAPSCLRLPDTSTSQKFNLTTFIKKNVADFLQGHLPAPNTDSHNSSSGTSPIDKSKRSKIIQSKIADGDIRGAVRMLDPHTAFAAPSPTTLAALRAKHPKATCNKVPPAPPNPTIPLTVQESAVSKAVASFPAGSSGGLDMLRPQHLKDLLSKSAGAAGGHLLTAVTRLCNIMLAGEVPPPICPTLYGASLCAISKNSKDYRPIAIGNTFRRLAAKLGSMHVANRVGHLLQPKQLGFGCKGGLEAAVHATRRYINFQHTTPKVLLKIDFKNAFNTVDRDIMLRTSQSSLPELSAFLTQCYSQPSSLVFGNNIISSEQGLQQGDPLGPALYCLTTLPLISSLDSELNLWYLDDGSLADNVDKVEKDFKTIVETAPSFGLEINALKCELYCLATSQEDEQTILDRFQTIAPGIQSFPLERCCLLGAPLSPSTIASSLQSKTEKLNNISESLLDLPSQCAYFILKTSQAVPKMTHILRSSPAWECAAGLMNFDNTLHALLEKILNVEMSELTWNQATLPISKGGIGIRKTSDIALPAFIASSFKCISLVENILPSYILSHEDTILASSLHRWETVTTNPPPSLADRHRQKNWDLPIINNSVQDIWDHASLPINKARLLGVSAPESGAFLYALPASSLGTLLSDAEFRMAISLRLGAPLYQPHQCKCGAQVTSSDPHGLSCRLSSGRHSRHSNVNALLQRAFSSAGYPSTREPAHLTGENNRRPDGVTIIPWKEGKAMTWDFTCGDNMAPSHLSNSSSTPLYVASKAETDKISKYTYLFPTHHFTPIAAECLGGFGPVSRTFLRELGLRIAAQSGDPRSYDFLRQHLSLAIQRGNAQSLLSTVPACISLEDDADGV